MKYIKIIAFLFIGALFAACEGDLDTIPLDKDQKTEVDIYQTTEDYKAGLAKIYAGLATTGQQGPAGQGDLGGIDEGISSYVRQLFYLQQFTTDETKVAWNDQTVQDLNKGIWTPAEVNVRGMYYRIAFEVALANEFIRVAKENTDAQIQEFVYEARFLRALAYWHALDMFGNFPFVTEEDAVGNFNPPMATRAELFQYVETELLDIENKIAKAGMNEYARADQGAVWMLLAKLYLNAEVYTGNARWADALKYSENIINAGYQLEDKYANLFLADNDNSNEIIFTVAFDGQRTQTWGGTTFIIHAAVGGDMDPSVFGIDGGWGGIRATAAFADKFDDISGDVDKRAMFVTDGQAKEIADLSKFTDGYAIAKYKNITSNGEGGSHLTFPDTDFPMFRLADAYLMYAEAVVRGGGGSATQALAYINELRERAYGDDSGNINAGELTLEFLLEERARELYWEAHRRTDLIRFGKFTDANYKWEWKGGNADGSGIEDYRKVFPIPSSDIGANPNLKQNPGY
ncbi:putative outer membrane starch-binding protein [Balneicella halophila]|uniref:Putative outer membrane starch-binding protein n=1 Tax=Balneicella halophila TaxID=1537566 RepID=A0A7L4UQ20_BALHA|nr:RagB/SusD family nutrient uptake outer membrane protein [Balneicella halophila]PVX51769.1 putative outer membrane starch-binding protein [Balneicella halophila]